MKIDWRVSTVAGGAAFGLSLLVGVIGGVAFVALILRASLAALVFAAGSIGIGLTIDRFLPELRRARSVHPGGADGAGVDIVVEGDDDIAALSTGLDESDPVLGDAEGGGDDQPDLAGESATVPPAVTEEAAALQGDGDEGIIGFAARDESADEAEVIEEVEAFEDASMVGQRDSVGELPSVDAMTDSFTEVPLAEEPVAEPLDSGEDPALMARAIRSVLKREE